MASLTVSIDSPDASRWAGALPIQARDVHKLVLAGTGVSGRGIALPPGRYLVTAMLPNGKLATVEDVVELGPGDSRRVDLSVPSVEVPVSLTNTVTMGDRFWDFARPVTHLFTSTATAIVKGNWLQTAPNSTAPVEVTREATSRSSLEIRDHLSWIEIERKSEYTYLAVPVDEYGSTVVQWSVDGETGNVDIQFDFGNGEVNSFFDFIRNDQSSGARAIGKSVTDRSDEYLNSKRRSPLLAVLGAYVLLRANQIDDMDARTDNLLQWFPWLPDALAVRIEYLARQGEHARASKLMLDAPGRGVPWFRSGVGYLENRARIYATVGASGRSSLQLAESENVRLADVARRFGELAGALDMTQSTTVLRGIPRVG